MTDEPTTTCPAADAILFTGFGPFGEHDCNPSWRVAERAAGVAERRVPSQWRRLDVTWRLAREWPGRVGGGDRRFVAVQFGLSASRATIGVERIARNRVGERPDVRGEVPEGDGLDRAGPERLSTGFDSSRVARSLSAVAERDEMPSAEVSEDAGDYVCNALYYHTLRKCGDAGSPLVEVLFLHVPRLEPESVEAVGRAVGGWAARWVSAESPLQ